MKHLNLAPGNLRRMIEIQAIGLQSNSKRLHYLRQKKDDIAI